MSHGRILWGCLCALGGAIALLSGADPLNAAGTSVAPPLTQSVAIRGGAYANTNYSGQWLATKASSDANFARRTLLKFDTANSIPAATSIARATLRLTVHSGGPAAFRGVGVYWIQRSFQQPEATWNVYRLGLPWTTPGGDLGARYAVGEVPNTAGALANFDLTTLVQDAVNNRYGTRYTRAALVDVGSSASASQGYRDYYSATDTLRRPQLLVTLGRRSPIRTVFLIVMENKNWSSIEGSTQAPYINKTLLPMSSYAEQYFNPPGLHPSLPNYLWLEGGRDFGVTDDNPPSLNHQPSTAHLVTQLSLAGISWRSYQEGISGTGCPLTAQNLYVPRHNPMVYFDDVTGGNDPSSAYCGKHVRPYSELAADLRNNTAARYNFITPNLCHDMHDCGVLAGDTWLSTEIPKIMASQAYKSGGAIFITFDEGAGTSDGPIGMIVLSPFAKGGGYSNALYYTHSSTLRTLQEIFAVTPLLGDAANARNLSDLFKQY